MSVKCQMLIKQSVDYQSPCIAMLTKKEIRRQFNNLSTLNKTLSVILLTKKNILSNKMIKYLPYSVWTVTVTLPLSISQRRSYCLSSLWPYSTGRRVCWVHLFAVVKDLSFLFSIAFPMERTFSKQRLLNRAVVK